MNEYIVITTLLLLSGSIWGWSSSWATLVHLAAILVLFFRRKCLHGSIKLHKQNTIVFFAIVCVYTLSMGLISKINPLTALNVYIVILGAFLTAELISKEDFVKKYINILVFMAAASLLFWGLSRVGVVIGDRIIDPGNGKIYRMNLFYIYRDSRMVIESGLNMRNFGVFWEGGAYQAFLNLAILFMIVFKQKIFEINKLYWAKLTILILTVVTTFSTVGYFLLIINMVLYLMENTNTGSRKRFIIAGVFLIISIIVMNSPAVVQKFNSSSDSYVSYLIRINDQFSGIKAALVSPIWGLGFNSERYTDVLNSFGIYANSSGLLIIAQQFGIIYAFVYSILQLKNFCKFCEIKKLLPMLLGIAFLILIFSSESLNQNGVFLLFLFSFRTSNLVKHQQYRERI